MANVQIPVSIRVKDGYVQLSEDSIQLHPFQLRQIRKQAAKKTKSQWHSSLDGVKIDLTSDQRADLIALKDQIFGYLSSSKNPVEILQQQRGFGFAKHAFKRILERVERLSEQDMKALGGVNYSVMVHPETLEKIVSSLIDSKVVHVEAAWKAHPFLNFCFVCGYDERELEIIVNFQVGIMIVTLIMKKESGYFIREVYSIENDIPIKKPSPY